MSHTRRFTCIFCTRASTSSSSLVAKAVFQAHQQQLPTVDCLWQNTHTDKHTPVISPLTTCRYSFTHSLVHLFIGISSIRGLEQQQPLCIPLCAPHLKEKERNCNVSICIELSFYLLLLLMLLLENWPINHGGADFPCLLHCELVSAK